MMLYRRSARRLLSLEAHDLVLGSCEPARVQVFRTEIISRRLPKSATLPLMAAALSTVACIMAAAAAATHPEVIILHWLSYHA